VACKKGASKGHVVAGGKEYGNESHQLCNPTYVLIDKEMTSLIICDQGNRRVVWWFLKKCTRDEILVDNICCWGLAMDKQGHLYVSDTQRHEVRRFTRGDTKGILVAVGNVEGDNLNQLNAPGYVFVDEEQSLYVSDSQNHRVMKWAKEGTLVAGGRGKEKILTQLNQPKEVWVDEIGTV
jgi:sugar lactone lactonase YvrE